MPTGTWAPLHCRWGWPFSPTIRRRRRRLSRRPTRALPSQTRRAESSCHVRGKSRANCVAAFVAPRIRIACLDDPITTCKQLPRDPANSRSGESGTGNRRCKITYPMSKADRCIGDAIASGASNVAATRDRTGTYSKNFLLYVRRHTHSARIAKLNLKQDFPRFRTGCARMPET